MCVYLKPYNPRYPTTTWTTLSLCSHMAQTLNQWLAWRISCFYTHNWERRNYSNTLPKVYQNEHFGEREPSRYLLASTEFSWLCLGKSPWRKCQCVPPLRAHALYLHHNWHLGRAQSTPKTVEMIQTHTLTIASSTVKSGVRGENSFLKDTFHNISQLLHNDPASPLVTHPVSYQSSFTFTPR